MLLNTFFLSFTPWFVVLTCPFWCLLCCFHLCVLLWFIPVRFVDVHFVVGASWAVEQLDCAHLLQWLHCPKELLKGPAQTCVTLQQTCHDGSHNGLQESNKDRPSTQKYIIYNGLQESNNWKIYILFMLIIQYMVAKTLII